MPETVRPEPSRVYRWMVLLVVSIAMFGNYYVYDALSPLADVLKQQLGFSDSNIGLLQAIYSFPNIFTVVIGGFIIDRIGLRKSLMIFGVLCLIGPAITAAAGHLWLMATGRLIFGMGAESLIVAVTAALARWFKGKELSFAFGINLTIARLGSFTALNSPTWARSAYANWRWPFLIMLGFSTLCVFGAVVYWIMETLRREELPSGRSLHRQSGVCRPVQIRRQLLVYRRPLHHFLFRHLPFPDFRGEVLHGSPRNFARDRRFSLQHADPVRDVCNAAIWSDGRPHRQTRRADDVRLHAADSRLPDDGLYPA